LYGEAVSDDNPYSEAQFKTLKYRPDFPARFGSIEDARAHCQQFFRWYNTEHRHSGIALMPPDTVYYGRSTELTTKNAASHSMPPSPPIRLVSRVSHHDRPAFRLPPGSIHPKRRPPH
jgi:putative transposase